MILWLNPVSGVSGDMLLGALLDLGAPLDAVTAAITSTGLTGWSLSARTVTRGGLRALHADVSGDQSGAELAEIAGRAGPHQSDSWPRQRSTRSLRLRRVSTKPPRIRFTCTNSPGLTRWSTPSG
jgi:uncharacterized protein (DUF111 family)